MADKRYKTVFELTSIDGVSRVFGQINSSTRTLDRTILGLNRTFLALGAGVSAVGLGYFTKGVLESQDKLSKLSQTLNISVEDLAGLDHASKQTGVSFEGLQNAAKRVSTQMLDTKFGLLEAKRNFSALGVEVTRQDGTLKGFTELLEEVADKFAALPDGPEKAALAAKLFGKSVGPDLVPFLNMGSAGIRELVEEGKRLNPVTAEIAKQSEQLNDNVDRLTKGFKLYGVTLINDALPAMNKVIDAMVRTQREGDGLLRTIGAGLFEFFTGDDAHKLNERIAEASDLLLIEQNRLDAMRSGRRGQRSATVEEIEAQTRAVAEAEAELRKLIALKPIVAPEDKPKPKGKGGKFDIPDEASLRDAEDIARRIVEAEEEAARDVAEAWSFVDKQIIEQDQKRADAHKEMWQQVFETIDQEQDEAIQHGQELLDAEEERMQKVRELGHDLGFTFSSAFEEAIVKGGKFRDVLEGIYKDILRIIIRKSLTEPLATGISAAVVGAFHSGGLVGRDGSPRVVSGDVFRGARRYHSGGLAGDEVPAILQRGEIVLPRGAGAGLNVTQHIHVGGNVTQADIPAILAAARTGALQAVAESRRRAPNGPLGR